MHWPVSDRFDRCNNMKYESDEKFCQNQLLEERDTIHCPELGNAWFRRQQPASTPVLLGHSACCWLCITYNVLQVIGSGSDPYVSLMWERREKEWKAWGKRGRRYDFYPNPLVFLGLVLDWCGITEWCMDSQPASLCWPGCFSKFTGYVPCS